MRVTPGGVCTREIWARPCKTKTGETAAAAWEGFDGGEIAKEQGRKLREEGGLGEEGNPCMTSSTQLLLFANLA